ncbi:MAG: M56 family metallopeptidase, partial [Clostridiales bacterium]|nr:M56 family metallopeptidase [Clostridiales bacterium]
MATSNWAPLMDMLVQSTGLMLVLVLLRPLLKRWLSARRRSALWLIPALRMLLPLRLPTTLSLWNLVDRLPREAVSATSPVLPALPRLTGTATRVVPALNTSGTATYVPAASATALPIDWAKLIPQLLVGLWALGVAIMAAVLIYTNWRFRRRTVCQKQLMTHGLALPLYLVQHLPSPCLTGLVRPRILLNSAALQSEEMLDMVLLHEMTHYRRRDHWWTALRAGLLCLYWWHPLAWLSARYSRQDAEAACDEQVIASMTIPQRQAYGMSLIQLMRNAPAGSLALSVGTGMSGKGNEMKERIAMIAKKKKRNRLGALCCVLALALLIPLLGTGAQTDAPATQDNAPAAVATTDDDKAQAAIRQAKMDIMAYMVMDDGIQGFGPQESVTATTLKVEDTQVPTLLVKLDALVGGRTQPVQAWVTNDALRTIRIDSTGGFSWVDMAFEPAPVPPLNRPAVVLAPDSEVLSLGITQNPADYGFSKEQLLNGTPVTILRILPRLSGTTLTLFDDPLGEWALIRAGGNQYFTGSTGYVPLKALQDADSFDQGKAANITGTLDKDTALLADTGLTDQTLGNLPAGTQVRLMGITRDYYHVTANGQNGFLPLAALRFDSQTQARLDKAQPIYQFEEVQPGWEARYQEFEYKLSTLYNKYGPVEKWTLAQKAEGSALAKEYGFRWISSINVLPGPEDLTEEQAYAAALAAAMKEYGFAEDDVTDRWIHFAYEDEQAAEPRWNVHFCLRGPHYDCAVFLDRKGQVVGFWKSPTPSPMQESGFSADTLAYYQDSHNGSLAQPLPDDPDADKAAELAFEYLKQAVPGAKMENYTHTADYYKHLSSELRWWVVAFTAKVEEDEKACFHVVLIPPEWGAAFVTDTVSYQDDLKWSRKEHERALKEKEWGPFIAWTLEQKAGFDPDLFAMPPEGGKYRQAALDLALQHLTTAFHLTRQQAEALTPCPSYLLDGMWRFDFMSGTAQDNSLKQEYVVV